ncbi:MAG: hypothetical protein ACM33B_13520 [Pseudomonadota bacterium]
MKLAIHLPPLVELLRDLAEEVPPSGLMALDEGDRAALEPIPGCSLVDEDVFWDALNGPVKELVRGGGRRAVGFVLPVEHDGGALCPAMPELADGVAVLAAWRTRGGAASLCELGEPEPDGTSLRWRGAHAEAQWMLTPLRGFVAARPHELALGLD